MENKSTTTKGFVEKSEGKKPLDIDVSIILK
jgi:hypothetical protein